MRQFSLFGSHPLTEHESKRSLRSLSLVGFFSSIATLMVVSMYHVYFVEVKGATYTQSGFIEGTAQFLAFIFKSFSGVLSDIIRQRKPLIFLGNFLSIIVKLIFVAAHTLTLLSVARILDRSIKGIRSSPTDALVADHSQQNVNRGRSYGFYKMFSMLGVVVGSLLAIFLMYITEKDYQFIFYASMIPGFMALFVLVFFVKQPPIKDEIDKKHKGWRLQDIKYLPKEFWILTGITFVFMFARFGENNIIFRARSLGWATELTPVLNITMELVSALIIYPIGLMADRSNRLLMLLRGMFVLFLANLVFISTNSYLGISLGTILAGMSLGMTQGLLSTLVADSTPAELRGTAFAIYYLVVGTAVYAANVIAGHLNDLVGTKGCFCGGLLFVSLAMFLCWHFFSYRRKVFSTLQNIK